MTFDDEIDELKDDLKYERSGELAREREISADMHRMNALLYDTPEKTTRQFLMFIGGIVALAVLAPYLP